MAQPSSCIPRALVDSRSPNLVLTVEKKRLQIPGLSANDNTVTGPQRRFNAYQRVRLAVYKTRIPAQSLKQEFSPFFPVVLLQMFSNFLSFSPSLAFLSHRLGWTEKAVLSILNQLNTWWLSNYRALTQAWGRIPIEANRSGLFSKLKDRSACGCIMYYDLSGAVIYQ